MAALDMPAIGDDHARIWAKGLVRCPRCRPSPRRQSSSPARAASGTKALASAAGPVSSRSWHCARPVLAMADDWYVAIGIASSWRVGTIALEECDRRAAGAVAAPLSFGVSSNGGSRLPVVALTRDLDSAAPRASWTSDTVRRAADRLRARRAFGRGSVVGADAARPVSSAWRGCGAWCSVRISTLSTYEYAHLPVHGHRGLDLATRARWSRRLRAAPGGASRDRSRAARRPRRQGDRHAGRLVLRGL